VVGTDLGLLGPLVSGMRSKGFHPLLTMAPDQAIRLTQRWSPDAVVVLDESGSTKLLLRHLDHLGIPTVLVSAPDSLPLYAGIGSLVVCLLRPVAPPDVARAAEIAASTGLGPAAEAGSFYFEPRSCLVSIDGVDVHLPPKELAIMAELARHPGEPVPSPQLVSHIYSECPATSDDIHRLVYRLRQLLGDHERVPPLIVNRRGFGYVLDLGTRVLLNE
jgi:hypothetical protein